MSGGPLQPNEATREQPVDLVSRSAIAAYVLLAGFIVIALGHPVPYNNEHHYLIASYRLFHPEFAISDPGLGEPLYGHLIFQVTAGALMTVLPLEVVGWLLRLLSWALAMAGIVLVSAKIGIRPWMAVIAIIVWLTNGQTILAHEWVIGGAEAKAFAYPMLLFAIHALLTNHAYRAAMLIGVGASLHPLVGVQLGGAICVAAVFLHDREWRIPLFAALVVLFALPGVIPTFHGMAQGPASAVDWRFVARFAMPFHLDPTSFPRRSYFNLGLLLSFNLFVCWQFRRETGYRLFGIMLVALMFLFAAGLAAWELGSYGFLQLMPFRVLPVLALLLFLLFIAALIRHRSTHRVLWILGAWGLLALSEPLAGLIDMRVSQGEHHRYPTGAFDWIAQETPNDALILSPPGATNSISRSERGQVAFYRWIRMRALDDWRERLETVLGPVETAADPAAWLSRYDSLTLERLGVITEKYGATHFVTNRSFDLPLLYQDAAGWRVYSLGNLVS